MSTEDGTPEQDEGADGAQPAAPQSNFERLITHLSDGSLAEKLVSAYAAADQGDGVQAIEDVITTRLDELKSQYNAPDDQQN